MAVSDKPWGQFTQADYTPQQWARACLVDTGQGAPDSKGRYKVPVREPDGAVSRGGAHAAAGGHGIGAVQGISPTVRQAAARRLVAIYRDDLGEEPPDGLMRMAGMMRSHDMPETERRFTEVVVELRAAGDSRRIAGYAAQFNKLSQNLGGFVERVAPSFFNKSRGDGWPSVVARYNHDDNMLLGTSDARTLELRIDEYGLWYEVVPPSSRADVVELVSRGDVRRSSFAFRLPAGGDEWGLSDQGYPQRTLVSGALVDVAPVNTPAYLDTTAGLRSLAEAKGADPDEVRALANDNELRKLFQVTSGPAPKPARKRLFGPAAVAAVLARREDPWV